MHLPRLLVLTPMPVDRSRWLGRVPVLARAVVIALGAVHAWAAVTQFSMNADGIAYLDMADAYLRGDWQTAISPVWSPLYAWVLGPVLHWLQPPMRWEFALVQAVNFAIFVAALLAFEFYWHEVTRQAQARMSLPPPAGGVGLPGWAWPLLGYALFAWTALGLIEIWAVTPDMLMAALVYLAAGMVMRLRRGKAMGMLFALLGGVLGLAYLAKAVMFPLALVLLTLCLLSLPDRRRLLPYAAAGLAVFVLLSLPYIAAISQAKGRLTLGEAGRLTYVRYANGVVYPHWQGGPVGAGLPLHPSRQILEQPPVYEFGSPIGGTYPISYDPSYWYEGVVPQYGAGAVARVGLRSAMYFYDLFLRQQGMLVMGMVLLYALGNWSGLTARWLFTQWSLAIFALAAFGLYALVYVEGRYVGAFVVLWWGDLLGNVRLPDRTFYRSFVAWVSGAMVALVALNILALNLAGLQTLLGSAGPTDHSVQTAPAPRWPGEVAQELHRLGIRPGDRVAIVGYGFDAFWARLAGVRIVAELLETDAGGFWTNEAGVQTRVIQAFAGTGARAIVAEYAPLEAELPNWHRVGNTSFYLYLLDE